MVSSTTYQEIMTQIDAWQDALQTIQTKQSDIKNLWQNGRYDQVIFMGCGSTHYLSQTAASLFQAKTSVSSRAVPASELLFHPESIFVPQKRTLMVAISRSGATTETIQAAQEFLQQKRGEVITVSCYSDKPLNQTATLSLAAHQGQEVSIAQTRSFSAMLVLVEGLARLIGGDPFEANVFANVSPHFIEDAARIASSFTDSQRFQRYFYLGSGLRYGLASEAMLKMKEMSLTSAEVFHPLEFRHGPKSMVDQETVVVGLLGDKAYAAEHAVLKEMKALGATTLAIGPAPDADYSLPQTTSALVYTMPILQWFAHQRAVNKGLDPDRPRNLEQVVHLESANL